MNYFRDNSTALVYQEINEPNSGLRPGQLGAIHAIAAHLLSSSEPAIVSLPTGYGKTAVMAAACFVAKASRVLVVVPTSALRNQTVKAFQALDVLRRLHALPGIDALQNPTVMHTTTKLASEDAWAQFTAADVVVVTPHTASPEVEGVLSPPEDFFDLVIVDEGHHSPARTWAAFIHQTPTASHLLFSATPFRRDRLQLPGRLVFHYPLKKAVHERAFGRVAFVPIQVPEDANRAAVDDLLIASAAQTLANDRAGGFDHRLLIRTDKISLADDLAERYRAAGINVESVSSRASRGAIADIEQRLHAGSLDGVVCVDMFGEGYDFPKFKIAVLHAAHRSLVPTLQFIGRFARTNDQNTGDATFIGAPSDINAETEELYREGVDWDVLLAEIADARQQLSIRERDTLLAFQHTASPSADYEAVSPASFRLPHHFAAYVVQQAPDFTKPPQNLHSLQVVSAWTNDEGTVSLLLTKEVRPPSWSSDESLIDSRHDCFLLKYNAATQILFITATIRAARYYAALLQHYFDGNAHSLAFDRTRKVLNGLEDQEFFSVGVRNMSPTPTTESYRILAGSQADRGIRDSDAGSYCQGHFFGRGEKDGESEIIGASAGGRVWSNGRVVVPALLEWLEQLHTRISSTSVNIGRSGLDRLSFGETLTRIPANTFTADWDRDVYQQNPRATWNNANQRTCVLDLEIHDVQVSPDGTSLSFLIKDDANTASLRYSLGHSPHYELTGGSDDLLVEDAGGDWLSVADWLEEYPLVYFTSEFSTYSGTTLHKRQPGPALKDDCLIPSNWTGCETLVEFDLDNENRPTVQQFLRQRLTAQTPDFLIYDHRSGEAADFIVGKRQTNGRLLIELYHCKAAGGEPSGRRVDDVYEIAGQSVKSVRFQRKDHLLQHIRRRTQVRPPRGHSPFLLGDRDEALALVSATQPIDIDLAIYAVQPGLSKKALTTDPQSMAVRSVIASANDSVSAQQAVLSWMVSP
jgi:superfamily II DNA or RNA helicase